MSRNGVCWMAVARAGLALTVLTVVATLSACGSGGGDTTPVLHWWVVPDRLDHASLAAACSSASDDYSIEVEELPTDVDQRRADLVRRLSAHDDSIDVLSVDTSLTAELASTGGLAPVPSAVEASVTDDVFPTAVAAATYDDTLVAAPWWLDPQLLWFRGSVAERAGIDTEEAITWETLLSGAERVGTSVQIDDPDGNGLSAWINALVTGAGGTLVSGPGRDAGIGLDTQAGRAAAGVVQLYSEAGLGPGPSADALERFAGNAGGFLLAGGAIAKDPTLSVVAADLQAVPYPVVDEQSVPPLAGVSLAVPKDAPDLDLAFEALSCLTSPEQSQAMMIGSGHGSVRQGTYDVATVRATVSNIDLINDGLASGMTVPQTPYWQRVRAGLRDTWTPLSTVSATTTPGESSDVVTDLVAGGLG